MSINQVGKALYGENWRAPLAKDLNINERTMRRYEKGELEVNPKLIPELINLIDQNIKDLQAAKMELANMMVGVEFEGYNAVDFYGHKMKLSDTPEYFVVLQKGDKINKSGNLVRHGVEFTQIEYMTGFGGVAFINRDDFEEPYTIKCRLIKA